MRMTTPEQPPERIYLQWYGSSGPEDCGKVSESEVSWSADKIFEHDFEYVRVSKPVADWKVDAERLAKTIFRLKQFLNGSYYTIAFQHIPAELEYGACCADIDQAITTHDALVKRAE